ncbi:hypothetical protein [Amycolatopsis sp. NPDC051372]|uniref:LppU/SCO3897 family protein n=1 Tax=Amycolatopsis sp. NPDC051372 TaxID=3155669 RepID=UPI003444CF99
MPTAGARERHPTDIRWLAVGDCIGGVTVNEKMATGHPRIVDCAGPDAKLRVDAEVAPGTQCNALDYTFSATDDKDAPTVFCLTHELKAPLPTTPLTLP